MPNVLRIRLSAVGAAQLGMLRVGDQVDLRLELHDAATGAPAAVNIPPTDPGDVAAASHPQNVPLPDFITEMHVASGDPKVRVIRVTLLQTGLIKFHGTLAGISGDSGPAPILVNPSLAPLSIVKLSENVDGAIRLGIHVNGAPSEQPLYVSYWLTGGPPAWAEFFANPQRFKEGIWKREIHWGNASSATKCCPVYLYQLVAGAHQGTVMASIFDKTTLVTRGIARLDVHGPL
jgi:hypothetical protein